MAKRRGVVVGAVSDTRRQRCGFGDTGLIAALARDPFPPGIQEYQNRFARVAFWSATRMIIFLDAMPLRFRSGF